MFIPRHTALCLAAILGAATAHLTPTPARAQTVITTLQDLQNINTNLAGTYILGADIDASATATWNNGAGFLPLGTAASPFTGLFNGNGHVITGLTISSTASAVGLFGQVGPTGIIQNIALSTASVTAHTTPYSSVGPLVGINAGLVAGASASGQVHGSAELDDATGGLIGRNTGMVTNAHAGTTVSGADSGGLVGDNFGTISNSFATGAVAGGTGGYRNAGGLAGGNYRLITQSYATGNVTVMIGRVGGLVGVNDDATISNAYATGSVTGLGSVGSPEFYAGGLVGENSQGAPSLITASYSTGLVSGTASYLKGGLVGRNDPGAKVTHSYWNITTSGRPKSSGGTGATTEQLQSQLPPGFSTQVWAIYPGVSFPFLPNN